jgi:hypothetical protein
MDKTAQRIHLTAGFGIYVQAPLLIETDSVLTIFG